MNWERQIRHLIRLIKDIIKYKRLRYNPNTRSYWNERLTAVDGFWRDENYRHIFELLPSDRPFTLLDIGCAVGDGCELLQERFPQATISGIDISDVGIEKAKQKSKSITYHVLDVIHEALPGTYDYITIIETLEHFDDPFPIIDKCLDRVREAVIVSTPYEQHYTGRNLGAHEHCYSFNEKTFSDYNCRVVNVTDFVESSQSRCIIYQIKP